MVGWSRSKNDLPITVFIVWNDLLLASTAWETKNFNQAFWSEPLMLFIGSLVFQETSGWQPLLESVQHTQLGSFFSKTHHCRCGSKRLFWKFPKTVFYVFMCSWMLWFQTPEVFSTLSKTNSSFFWKWMVGRRLFPFGMAPFWAHSLNFGGRKCIHQKFQNPTDWTQLVYPTKKKDLKPFNPPAKSHTSHPVVSDQKCECPGEIWVKITNMLFPKYTCKSLKSLKSSQAPTFH